MYPIDPKKPECWYAANSFLLLTELSVVSKTELISTNVIENLGLNEKIHR